MIRLATVGTSAITEKFLAACRRTGRYRLLACCSRTEERAKVFAKAQGFEKTFTSLEEMAADPEIDAVYIASPNVFHFPQSKLFLETGKHVICEKPIATCAREYRQLLELAQGRGLIYMEAIMSRHCAGRKVLHDGLGQIGKITQARIDFCQRSSRYDSFLRGEPVNIFDMSLAAGTLMDLGVYCVYAALDLFGPPEKVTAAAAFLPNGADGAGTAILTYPDFLATLTYSKTGHSAVGTEIIGDRGALCVGSISQYADIRLEKEGVAQQLLDTPERTAVMSGEAGRFADYVEHFSQYQGEYEQVCLLTEQVHTCMDDIKDSAGIRYPAR